MPTSMPLLGMGTKGMGGGKYGQDFSNVDASVAVLKLGFDLGIKLVDVAELYADGLGEEIVGRAMKDYPRGDIFIISKVWKTNLKYDEVLRALKGSLARLKTDYIDLYLIHYPSEEGVPLTETMRAMESLLDDGLIKNIGVSNFDVALTEEAQKNLKHGRISANQIEYSLTQRSAEKDIIPFCKNHGIKVIAYRPLARGTLSAAGSKAVDVLVKKYQKTPAQIALNWIISQDMVAIPGALKPEHIKENSGALGWKMAQEDIEFLKTLS
ncbi:MAG: aldo/keto reductase [Candidatus Giovannonibacteria bacterium]|nr:aldo/keto reductase [Candidatus Giovannonibacteria bacterium]